MCNTNVEKKFLPQTVGRKKNSYCETFPGWHKQRYLLQTNIEISINIVSAKSELNLQQLKHFHMLLKMLEIVLSFSKS